VRLEHVEGLEVLTWDDVKAMLSMERMKDLLSCAGTHPCRADTGEDGLPAGVLAGGPTNR
jgi:Arc/MetJ-type ribon-helix-helix transcriptional regulator